LPPARVPFSESSIMPFAPPSRRRPISGFLRKTFLILGGTALLTWPLACSDGDQAADRTIEDDPRAVLAFERALPPQPAASADGDLKFVDITRDAGITFRSRSGTPQKLWIPENIGHGAMFFDFDNDGDLDIYFANGGDLTRLRPGEFHNELWRNEGNGRFVEATKGSGLECPEWSCGVYTVDFDADGWRDVYVTQLGKNRLFRNLEGSGRFQDVTDAVGGGDEGWGTSAAFFDADGDGDLDLYVANYLEFDIANPPADGVPCEWRNLKVCCGPRGLVEAFDRFYEFRDGRFVEATEAFGFIPRNQRDESYGAYSLGVVAADFDDDGDTDVYVAVDSRANLLFQNQGQGKFEEKALDWLLAMNRNGIEQAGMGVTAADLNEDGHLDIFVTNFSHDTNTLYLNGGDPSNLYFDDITSRAGLGGSASYSFLSWGTGIYDFDLDGKLDIFVASGHVYPQADGATDLGTSYAQPNQLFMGGEKPLSFSNRAKEAGPVFTTPRVSRGTSFADLDRDGRMDWLVTNVDDWPQIIHNRCTIRGHWLGLELRGRQAGNRDAIGATLRIELADGRVLRRDQLGGGGYFGSNQPIIVFGFGDAEPKALHVRWPDGEKMKLSVPELDRYHRLDQEKGSTEPIGR
jgi:enediyne biosynthesis protein E4